MVPELKSFKTGDTVDGLTVLLEKVSVMKTKKGGNFLKFAIRDKSASIDGVFWNYDQDTDSHLKDGAVVSVTGRFDAYNGTPQFVADRLVLIPGASADQFARRTKFDVETLWSYLVDKIGTFQEPLTKFIADELMLRQAPMVEALKRAPAAKTVHNDWYGGLLEHVWSLCEIAEPVIAHYQRNYLDKISRDKVLFGLMLHDAGKVVEYDYRNPAFTFTAIGTMTPHIVLGPAWVYEQANKWMSHMGAEAALVGGMTMEKFKFERAHLMHILAAHHGQLEWGSPVKPCSIEAVLVHHLDNLDSKVLHAWDYVLNRPGTMDGMSRQSGIERVPYVNYSI